MPALVTACPAGHEIRSSADRTPYGYCRECKREDDRMARLKAKAALGGWCQTGFVG